MIVRMLDISTAHVTEETMGWLDTVGVSGVSPLVVYDKSEYGWWVYTPPEWEETETADIPADLLAVLTYAKGKNCAWVMFDCDSDRIDELPQYQ